MTNVFRVLTKSTMIAAAVAALAIAAPRSASAQDDPNPGALTFTGGVDFPSLYLFRGIRQESEPALTMFPYGDLGIALASGDGGVKSVGINIGTWHSLQTGSSGSDGPSEKVHYEEDFYATFALGFGGGVSLGTTYTAYTSPNFMFTTVKEVSFKIAKAHMLNPYGVLAFELGGDSAGQADGGSEKGSYLELGVGPTFPLGGSKFTLTIPVKLGFSLKDYYEHPLTGEDSKFGFFDIGALITLPLSKVPSSFGAWNIHGGVDVFALGDTTKYFNNDDKAQVVGLIGIGVSY